MDSKQIINTKHKVPEYYKGWNQDARNKIERYLEARENDAFAKLNKDLITSHVIEWRNIRVIVATNDLAILKPQLSEVCDYLICDEAGQGRHIQIITIASRMLIKTLFMVGVNNKFNHNVWVN